jgi:hypothetical protein
MSSIDSLSEIVLGNVKLPAEDEQHIVPFLRRIKQAYGIPLGGGDSIDGAHHPDGAPHELTYVDMDTFLSNF